MNNNSLVAILVALLVIVFIAGIALNPLLAWLWGIILAVASFITGLLLPVLLVIIIIVLICRK